MVLLRREEGRLVRSRVDMFSCDSVDQSHVTACNTDINCFLVIHVADILRHVRHATLSSISWDDTSVRLLPVMSRSSIVSDQIQEHSKDDSCSSVS